LIRVALACVGLYENAGWDAKCPIDIGEGASSRCGRRGSWRQISFVLSAFSLGICKPARHGVLAAKLLWTSQLGSWFWSCINHVVSFWERVAIFFQIWTTG